MVPLTASVCSALVAVLLCACVATGIGVGSVFPQAASPWTGCSCDSSEDPQLVGNLLEQLSSSTEKFISCRQQLLRQKYHVPIIIGDPFGSASTIAWQLASAFFAVLCAVLYIQLRHSKADNGALKQHLQQREAAWRQAITAVHASAQERLQQWQQRDQGWQQKQASWQQQISVWREKEAAWQQGVQEVVELVQQREAALSDQGAPAGAQQQSAAKVRNTGCSCPGWAIGVFGRRHQPFLVTCTRDMKALTCHRTPIST